MNQWHRRKRGRKKSSRFKEPTEVCSTLQPSIMSEALLEQVRRLEAEVLRLKAQLKEKESDAASSIADPDVEEGDGRNSAGRKKGKKGRQGRVFDFSVHPRRHVALRLAYLGWGYQGFAVQENTANTVEAQLFEALLKTRLIQDRQSSNYHRCGRTDKGVSAFSQVISIDLRSTQFGFSARFDCQSRTYRYYFPRGDLDVELMSEAAKRYEGTHDFRNLCKMDVGNGVLQFQRTILSATIRPSRAEKSSSPDPYELFIFEIKGLAFLYHQVRCMMAVLLLIGRKLEAPELIDQLLDVQNNPRKPQYSMAVDYPLVLHECHFEGLHWQSEPEEVTQVLAMMQHHWIQTAVKTQVVHGMIRGLQESGESCSSLPCWLLEGTRQRNYRPLLERPRCESLESRIEHFVKRGRLELEEGEDGDRPVHRGKRSKHQLNHLCPPSNSSSSEQTSQ
ncbi:hypothetical protein GJAV_G00150700 [Gymnothorax javanicus]|nr:hypothetical protein GJAV_G00150700 [Gymnothorax javanicus]